MKIYNVVKTNGNELISVTAFKARMAAEKHVQEQFSKLAEIYESELPSSFGWSIRVIACEVAK